MNTNTAIIMIILTILLFIIIVSFNNQFYDHIQRIDNTAYENCVYDCQDRYASIKNKKICINEFCEGFK